MSVELDVRNYLLGSVASCTASNTFVGPWRKTNPSGGLVVAVQSYGGERPYGFLDGRKNKPYRPGRLQIKVTSPVNGYLVGKSMADKLWLAMDRVSPASLGSATSNYYVRVMPLQAEPIHIGQNDTEQDQFSINVELSHGGFNGEVYAMFMGSSAVAIDTEAEVLAELDAGSTWQPPGNVTLNVGTGEYGWLVFPTALDIDTFTVNGLTGGFVLIGSATINGIPSAIWRTAQQSLGVIDVEYTK